MLMSGMALLRKNVSTIKIEKTIGMFHMFQLEKCSPASTWGQIRGQNPWLANETVLHSFVRWIIYWLVEWNGAAFFCQINNLLID